ncbi:hypothetical protein A9174_12700 [Mesorhizobium loti NZP2037]|nr:hypothetical protein A9174_12700 [Mesorhizobium loti NZP2037]
MALIRPNPDVVDTRFLHYSFFGADWRETISEQTLAGSTVDRIPLIKFPNFPINIPPLATQRHIVSFLAAFDDLIRNNTRRIVILEDMARRIYQEWFVRFRHPTCEGRPLIGSELGPIPQDWEVVSLGAICDHGGEIKTGPFGSQLHQSDYKTEGVPVVMPTNLILGRVDPVGIARIGEEKWRQLTRHHLKAGDIVYGRRGDIGRKALIGEDQEGWLCGTGCIRLSVRNDRLSAIYLSHFLDLDSVKQNIAARAVGSTMPNLNTSIMENTLILVPPTALQREFARSATNTDKLVRCLLAQNRNLRTQRDLLLPKLISGAIDVSEAEELLEAAE